MDKEREELKQYIENADIPDELKSRELAIVANTALSIPEVKMELAKLISEDVDATTARLNMNAIPQSNEERLAYKEFELISEEAGKNLKKEMELVQENLELIADLSNEIEKVSASSSV
ncbi:MAG: hypothetical protein WDZ88_00015 [Candidatus Paceibacterota bacterium]